LTGRCANLKDYFEEKEKPKNLSSDHEKVIVDILKGVVKIWSLLE
jgi:hypothetical protein